MQSWIHKIVTENHQWVQLDVIYDMYFHERGSKRLYFSYKADNVYWVDYIDLDSLETNTDGYIISEVFSWWTSYEKKLLSLLRATSNTSWSNYIKLYYRVNNWTWTLVRTINDSTDTITRDEINSIWWEAFRQNIDVQFKIELHRGQTESPVLHEFINNYELI